MICRKAIGDMNTGDEFIDIHDNSLRYIMVGRSQDSMFKTYMEAVLLTDFVPNYDKNATHLPKGTMVRFPLGNEFILTSFGSVSQQKNAEERTRKEEEGKKKQVVHNKENLIKRYAEQRAEICKYLILFSQRFNERDQEEMVWSDDKPPKPVHKLLKQALNDLPSAFKDMGIIRGKMSGQEDKE